jgi:hypothetical protein
MAGTDTIVGIVGAVLLAAVMVGVFAYEYNNAPASAPAGDAALIQHFHQDFPTLNATGDIDQNGIPNYKDPAFETPGEILATFRFTGTMPQPTPPATSVPPAEFRLHVEEGNVATILTLTYNATTPAPLPGLPTLDLTIAGSSDITASSPVRAQASGSTAVGVTITTQTLQPGEYTLRVSQTQPGPATAFAVKAVVDYGPGHAGGHHTH